MHAVELKDEAFELARRVGFKIREEWLGGNGGGGCVLRGQKWLFVDLALDAGEQLEQVSETLSAEPGMPQAEMSTELRNYLGIRDAA